MILPDFILPSRQNQVWNESGIDSYASCLDKKHFKSYPHKVEYRYNSRGFRDTEWPETLEELKECIWCFGDSFTVGLGSPIKHTWANILESNTNKKCINVSMDGASNNWIARKVAKVITEINPKDIIIHWSYLHRGESQNHSLPDEKRQIPFKYITDDERFYNFEKLLQKIENIKANTNIIHSVIPKFFDFHYDVEKQWAKVRGSFWPEKINSINDFYSLSDSIIKELQQFNLYDDMKKILIIRERLRKLPVINEFKILDYARDYHHYDILTADNFVNLILTVTEF